MTRSTPTRPSLAKTIVALLFTACLTFPLAASPAQAAIPPYEVNEFTARSLDESGGDYTPAGGHPFEATTSFSLSGGELKDVFTELPPGFLGNVGAFPRCPPGNIGGFFPSCPPASVLGSVFLTRNGGVTGPFAIYNIVPEEGFPAEFGFNFGQAAVFIYPQLRPRTGGYGVTVQSIGVPKIGITQVTASFYGTPSVRNGAGGPEIPFLSNPVDCSEAHQVTNIAANSWENPGPFLPDGTFPLGSPDLSSPIWSTASFSGPPVTGCDDPQLTSQFKPAIEAKPEQGGGAIQAEEPSGLHVALDFPQSNDPTDPHTVFDALTPQTPEMKTATVKFPAGMSVSPSSADGLGGCSDEASDPSATRSTTTRSTRSPARTPRSSGRSRRPHLSCPPTTRRQTRSPGQNRSTAISICSSPTQAISRPAEGQTAPSAS